MRFENEFIIREVQKLVDFVAAIVNLNKYEQLEEAEQEIDAAYGRLLNMDRQLFDILDARSVAKMLADPDRIKSIVKVMQAEADILRARRKVAEARRRYQRALQLLKALEDEPECVGIQRSLETRIEQLN